MERVLADLPPDSHVRPALEAQIAVARQAVQEANKRKGSDLPNDVQPNTKYHELDVNANGDLRDARTGGFGLPPDEDSVLPGPREETVPETPQRPVRPVDQGQEEGKSEDDFVTPDRPPSQPDPNQTVKDTVRDVTASTKGAVKGAVTSTWDWANLVAGHVGASAGSAAGGTGSSSGSGSSMDVDSSGSGEAYAKKQRMDPSSLKRQGLNYTMPSDHAPEGQMLTNTRTALLKWEGYLSINRICTHLKENQGENNAFDIRLNHPYFPLDTNFIDLSEQLSKTGPSVFRAKAVLNQMPNVSTPATASTGNVKSVKGRGILFPRQIVATSDPVGVTDFYDKKIVGRSGPQRCAWSSWYDKIYDYYHVLEANYVVTIEHASNSASDRQPVLIGVHEEAYVENNPNDIWPYSMAYPNAEGQPARDSVSMSVEQAKRFKGMRWYKLENRLNATLQPWKLQIRGNWTPGSIEGSVKNLDDIKQWYPTGQAPAPVWEELHGFWFFLADDTFAAAGTGTNTQAQNANLDMLYPAVNVKVEVEYKVQYKGLKTPLHFAAEPSRDGDCVKLVFGPDNCQFPYPTDAHQHAPLGDP